MKKIPVFNKALPIWKQYLPASVTQISRTIHALSVLSQWKSRYLLKDARIPCQCFRISLKNASHDSRSDARGVLLVIFGTSLIEENQPLVPFVLAQRR